MMAVRLWTWSGRFFGERDDDDLWTLDGRHVGRFHGDDVYGPDGRYLGELLEGRLVTRVSKRAQRVAGFTPQAQRAAMTPFLGYPKFALYEGFEDFPEV